MNRWDLIKKMHLVLGLIIFAGIVVPWYVLVQKANPQFLHFFFVTQQVSRFLTTQAFNSKAVVWFYVPVVLAGIFPWCVFVVQALSQKIIAVYRDRKSHGYELYLLLWIVLVFIFFSIPRSKTVGYILPIFPAMALVIGHYLSIVWQNTQQKSLRIGLWSYILLALGISVLCFAAPHIAFFNVAAGLVKYLYMMGVSFLIAALLVFGLRHRSLFYSFAVIFGSAVLFLLVLLQSAAVLNEKTVKPLVMEVKSRLHPDDQIIAYYRYYQDLPIYLEKRIVIVADWNAPDIAQNDNWLRELWYGMSFQDTRQWLIDDNQFWKRWRSSQHLYVFARASDLEQFKAKAKGSLYEIKQSNGVVLLSNQSFPLPVPLSQ